MKTIGRPDRSISLKRVRAWDEWGIELRVHGDAPRGDALALLDAKDAVALARALLAEAEKLMPGGTGPVEVEKKTRQMRRNAVRVSRQMRRK